MRTLYHLPLSSDARTARLALTEKGLEFELRLEKVWERREPFLQLNPACDVPVLVEPDGAAVCGGTVIIEYLEDICPDPALIGLDPATRAEVRRLAAWFHVKLSAEATDVLVHEKIMKRYLAAGVPDTDRIRAARSNVRYHLDYVCYLSERRRWLAGDNLSYADLAAAAHFSVLDYLGDVPWDDYREARIWYGRLKSRPSFRPLLEDRVAGMPPPHHYVDLDF